MKIRIISFPLKLKTLGIGIAIFVVSYVIIGILFQIPLIYGLYQTMESFIYFQIFTPTAQPTKDIVIIDEENQIYDRQSYANLISGLDRLGAKVISFDILFAGNREFGQDSALVAATRAASKKIIHAVEFINQDNHAIFPDKFHINTEYPPSSDKYIHGVLGAILPFDNLLEITVNLGFVSARTDIALFDKQYFPLLIHYNDKLYPSLPLLSVVKFLDYPRDLIINMKDDFIELKNDSQILKIPIDAKSQILINFISPPKFSGKVISVEEALAFIENPLSKYFKDKIVLIGNSMDSKEQTAGPHFEPYPNLFMYASLISQILNQQNIKEGDLESHVFSFIIILLGIIWIIFFLNRFDQIKMWHIVIISFVILILTAVISINLRLKIYVLFPYIVFLINYISTKQFYLIRLYRPLGSKKKITYFDYYLLIGPKRKQENTYPVFLIDSPAGEDFCEMKFPISSSHINKIRNTMATNLSLDDKTLKKFGANLFQALFQPDIRDQFDKSLGMAFEQKVNLRIKLRIDAPELARYPWEYMYDGKQTKKFLARNKNISITRFLKIAEPVRKMFLKPPLKIMVVISNPYNDLKVEKEKNLIKDALARLEKRGLVKLKFMKKATLKEFVYTFKKEKFDVFHFIGHGEYSAELGGCLAFESEHSEAELVNVDKISTIMEEKSLRLVVLNACQTGEISKSEISLGVAEGLVKIGIPAVIAMQFRIPDDSATEFSKDFYTTLAETFQVDRAVTEARRNLFINLSGGRIDWGIPVLFMQKDDGVIFE